MTGRKAWVAGAAPLLLFFAAIGLGFMLVEESQLQRLMIFLGHPTYSLSTVLFTLRPAQFCSVDWGCRRA